MSLPLTSAGSLFGPISTKSLYITSKRITPSREELFLLRSGVYEHHVRVAASRGIERLPGALRDRLHVDSRFPLEDRQEVAERAGVLCRRGRGHNDRSILSSRRRIAGCGAADRNAMHYLLS